MRLPHLLIMPMFKIPIRYNYLALHMPVCKTYENKLKLYKRLDKELEGTDRVFLKILKNDIKELEPIDDYTEYLIDQMAEYDREARQNNHSDYDL